MRCSVSFGGVQVVDAVYRFQNRFAFVGLCLVQRLGRRMQEFVGQGRCSADSSTFSGLSPLASRRRAFSISCAALAFGMVAQGADGRHHFARFHPVDEFIDAGIDDDFGFLHRALARIQAVAHHFGQIVHGVQEDIAQFRDFLFHVARHGQIDDEQGTMLARLERAFDHALAQDRQAGWRCR